MTAIAGFLRFADGPEPSAACARMLAAQRLFGSSRRAIIQLGQSALGISPFIRDSGDRQEVKPVRLGGGGVLVADVRIDNRHELRRLLGAHSHEASDDAQLLGLAYSRWGDRLLERLVGDFAFAVWDGYQQSLVLARDCTGQRPLHFFLGRGYFAFASMPSGLHALDEVPCAIDLDSVASFVADIPLDRGRTFFRSIERVPPASLVRYRLGRLETRNYWERPRQSIRYKRETDYVEGLREQLDRATAVRLRDAKGVVGTHLSAGLDSNAVTSTAARVAVGQGLRVLSMTTAPRLGFSGPAPLGRICDESGLAALTAAAYPNIDHLVLRTSGTSPFELLGDGAAAFQEPVGHPCNHVWWSEANEAARKAGVSIVLTGEAGNLTLSAGNYGMLADLVREGRWGRWLREAQAAARSGLSWRTVLSSSFSPWVPLPVWKRLERLNSGQIDSSPGISLLASGWRDLWQERAADEARVRRPEKDSRAMLWKLLQAQDSGNFRKGALARWGIDERDPTADRRLAEYCFAVPPEQFFGGGLTRRLARLALEDRVPRELLNPPRGYQFADWHESVDARQLSQAIDALETSAAATSLIDVRKLRTLASSWPPAKLGSLATIRTHRVALLRALAAGDFVRRLECESRRPSH